MNGFQKRILVPLVVPVAATLVAVAVVFNFSRVLIAVEERRSADVATTAAILAAVAVLAGCAFFAPRRQARPAGLAVLATSAFLLMFGGGYGLGASSAKEGGGEGEAAGNQVAEVAVVAKDPFLFEPKELTAPAGAANITVTNQGTIIHSLEFENLPGFKKVLVSGTQRHAPGKGAIESSRARQLKPGTYVFFCSESGHRGSGMEGTLTVQ
jgi:plastocyanin